MKKINSLSANRSDKKQNINRKETSSCICFKASYTLETTIVLPFFTVCLLLILFWFRVLGVQQAVGNALLHTGRELSVLSCVEKENKSAVNVVTAKGLFIKNLKNEKVVDNFVSGGRAGISLQKSEFSGEYIQLKAEYKIKFPIGLYGKKEIKTSQQTICRKWVGKDFHAEETSGKIVYITPQGSVYHDKRSCSAIALSIEEISRKNVSEKRNQNGAKYYACPVCAKKSEKNDVVYITKYGNRFHADRACSELKRTVAAVHLSQVKDRRLCEKCKKSGGEK